MAATKTLLHAFAILVAWLVLGGAARAETTYHLSEPIEDATYSDTADIAVSGTLGGDQMSDFANITLTLKLVRVFDGTIHDSFNVTTDMYGMFSGEFDIDGEWLTGDYTVWIYHGGQGKFSRGINIE